MNVVIKVEHNGKAKNQTIDPDTSIILGRSSRCECKLEDELASGVHCRLHLKPDRLEIYDLESKNGTYLNGIRIERSEMFMGDELRIGNTKITLEEEKMEKVSVDLLTFPGPFKDRISHELKADFTGARIQNQLFNHKNVFDDKAISFHAQEVYVRRSAKTSIKLSKQEIKARHKILATLATIIDTALLIGVFTAVILMINSLIDHGGIHIPGLRLNAEQMRQHRLSIITFTELFCLGLYYFLNFKIFRFTLGEKIAGVEERYVKQ